MKLALTLVGVLISAQALATPKIAFVACLDAHGGTSRVDYLSLDANDVQPLPTGSLMIKAKTVTFKKTSTFGNLCGIDVENDIVMLCAPGTSVKFEKGYENFPSIKDGCKK